MTTIAREIMSTHLVTIKEGDSVEDALKTLVNHKITGVPVVDQKGHMVGVLSEYDIISQLADKGGVRADEFHSKAKFSDKPFTLSEEAPLEEIVKHFIDHKYRRIPIVAKDGKLVGIITRRDLMRLFFYRAKLG